MAGRKLRWTFDGLGGTPALRSEWPPGSSAPAPPIRDLEADQVPSVFQPIVDLSNGKTFAHEGLVRCTVPCYEDPLKLFQAAVAQGVVGRLGRIVRSALFERGAGLRLFVNLHPLELSARWLVRPDDPICSHDGELFLEITESAAIEHFDLCDNVLGEVCSRTGAKLVIDDFGAGYSNLERIVRLEPSVVKLDRALVANLDQNLRKRVLVMHVVSLCADLGATVVAEGIETSGELAAVTDAGAHYGQGFLLARPAWPIPAVHWARPTSSVDPS